MFLSPHLEHWRGLLFDKTEFIMPLLKNISFHVDNMTVPKKSKNISIFCFFPEHFFVITPKISSS